MVEGHIAQGIAGVVVGINRHSRVLAVFVRGPSVRAEFFDEVRAVLGDVQVEPLHDVNALPDAIGPFACWLDVEAKAVYLLD